MMGRRAGIAAAILSLTLAAGAAVVWIVRPELERRWMFFPARPSPEQPWRTPDGAEEVTFTATDGVRLRGWFLAAAPPITRATILVLHGNWGNLPQYLPDAEILRRRGFNVLLFNYRGFGLSEGETRSETTIDRDAMAALQYLTTERGIDPQSIVFIGASLGSAVAATLAARSPCRAVALISAMASARRHAERAMPWLPSLLLDNLVSPFDTIGRIGQARCPVLVMHGADDRVIPLAEAKEVYDAARWPKRLIVVPGATHGLLNMDGPSYLGGLIEFLVNLE